MDAQDVYADAELAELYDLVYAGFDDDVTMYEQFAHASSPSLEICVGSGRVALPLVRRGLEIVGLDASAPMLARLAAAVPPASAGHLRIVEGDMRDFDLGEAFELVYCAFGSFEQLLTSEDQLACLRSVARHLAPGGAFVAELRSLPAIDWDAEPVLLHDWTRPGTHPGEQITKLRSMSASPARQTTVDTVIFDRTAEDGSVRRRQIDVAMRAIGKFEVEYLLAAAGLRLKDVYGDTDLSPYTDASDRMIIVAGLSR